MRQKLSGRFLGLLEKIDADEDVEFTSAQIAGIYAIERFPTSE